MRSCVHCRTSKVEARLVGWRRMVERDPAERSVVVLETFGFASAAGGSLNILVKVSHGHRVAIIRHDDILAWGGSLRPWGCWFAPPRARVRLTEDPF